jgi:hypothetical protein
MARAPHGDVSMRPLIMSLLALAVLAMGPGRLARAETDPCSGYKWDVSKERALFGTTAKQVPAGKDRASATPLAPSQLYEVMLVPVSQVSFPVTPGKAPPSGSYAGILALTPPAAGKYRIAVDVPLWIDVAAGGVLAAALDYEGQHECNTPRKVVVFDLTGSSDWLLQISAADRAQVRLTVTAVR